MVTTDDFRDWLAHHGIDWHQVQTVEFTPQGVKGAQVFLTVTQLKLNEEGERFLVWSQGERVIAKETVMVPLQTFPNPSYVEVTGPSDTHKVYVRG